MGDKAEARCVLRRMQGKTLPALTCRAQNSPRCSAPFSYTTSPSQFPHCSVQVAPPTAYRSDLGHRQISVHLLPSPPRPQREQEEGSGQHAEPGGSCKQPPAHVYGRKPKPCVQIENCLHMSIWGCEDGPGPGTPRALALLTECFSSSRLEKPQETSVQRNSSPPQHCAPRCRLTAASQ